MTTAIASPALTTQPDSLIACLPKRLESLLHAFKNNGFPNVNIQPLSDGKRSYYFIGIDEKQFKGQKCTTIEIYGRVIQGFCGVGEGNTAPLTLRLIGEPGDTQVLHVSVYGKEVFPYAEDPLVRPRGKLRAQGAVEDLLNTLINLDTNAKERSSRLPFQVKILTADDIKWLMQVGMQFPNSDNAETLTYFAHCRACWLKLSDPNDVDGANNQYRDYLELDIVGTGIVNGQQQHYAGSVVLAASDDASSDSPGLITPPAWLNPFFGRGHGEVPPLRIEVMKPVARINRPNSGPSPRAHGWLPRWCGSCPAGGRRDGPTPTCRRR